MSDSSLVNVGDLAKPLDTLIKKISKGTGILYEPRRIRNIAKAEAEAAVTKAEYEIEITDLHRRAERRRLEEEARHQKNIEDIIAKAEPHLNENANPDNMDDDWIINLFDKCRIVSDEEMQSLWARVLATEANTSGTLSKRTVNLLSDFDKSDAELFTKLCGYCWDIGHVVLLVFNWDQEIYNRNGIDFDVLRHLESIGLIQWEFGVFSTGFIEDKLPAITKASYYGRCLCLEVSGHNNGKLPLGKVLLTKIGQELAPICGSKPVDGFYEYVTERWKEYLPASERE